MKTADLHPSSLLLQTFFQKFDLFADAPDAVAKMRELVLNLAVQGKLVVQKESDGNAGKIFPEGLPPEGVSRYDVAKNWIWIRFAAVGDQRLGKMLDQKGNRGELKPYLRNTNVQWMRFQLDDIKELRLEPNELDEYRLLPGDLLICEGGEPGRCAIWRGETREMYFQKAIHRVRPRKGILSEYLAICLRVDAQNGVLAGHFTGATIKHFTGRSLSEYSIPLPPLAEQKRIVAKVDELMALCDRLEAQQQEREAKASHLARASLARFADAPTPANLDYLFHSSFSIPPSDLRKSILTLAVQGKLVPQDPNDEPVHADSESETLFEIPTNWRWHRLGTLGPCRTGKTPPTSDPTNYGQGFPFIGPGQITSSGRFTASEKSITPQGLEKSTGATLGDILMVCIGGSIGKAAICRETIGFNQQINSVRLQRDLPEFVYLAVTAGYFQEQVLANASGSATPIINKGRWEQIPIPLPPLAEQRRIVAKVEQLMALVDALETQLAASRTTAANLLSALVAELTVKGAECHE